MRPPNAAARPAGLSIWLADVRGATTYTQLDWTQLSALIIGREAEGATPFNLPCHASAIEHMSQCRLIP